MSGYMLHVIRQITTDRNYNKTLLKNRRNKKNTIISKKKNVLRFKEVSGTELEIIKLNIRKKGRKERRRVTILTFISISILFVLIYLVLKSTYKSVSYTHLTLPTNREV